MERLPFETYYRIAREIVENTGNLRLAKVVLEGYLMVHEKFDGKFINPLDPEKIKVARAYDKLTELIKEKLESKLTS